MQDREDMEFPSNLWLTGTRRPEETYNKTP